VNTVPPSDDLTLQPLDAHICRVLDGHGVCLGHFKRIQGVWKFKALGRDAQGQTVPGGGPLTHRHNAVLTELTPSAANATLRRERPV
jgi:hypothetical protein